MLGDGSVPVETARAATMPALVLAGDESDELKHEAAEALVKAMPRAQRKTLEGQATMVSPEALAPVLVTFLNEVRHDMARSMAAV